MPFAGVMHRHGHDVYLCLAVEGRLYEQGIKLVSVVVEVKIGVLYGSIGSDTGREGYLLDDRFFFSDSYQYKVLLHNGSRVEALVLSVINQVLSWQYVAKIRICNRPEESLLKCLRVHLIQVVIIILLYSLVAGNRSFSSEYIEAAVNDR